MKHRYKLVDWVLKMVNERHYGKLSWSVDNKDEYLSFQNSGNIFLFI